MKSILFFIAFCLALIPVIGQADTTDNPAGLDQLKKYAESGDTEAMLELGILYEFGYRMTDNKAHALAWYRLAAEAGNVKAGARQDVLKPTLNTKELEDANRIYEEARASRGTVSKPIEAPVAVKPAEPPKVEPPKVEPPKVEPPKVEPPKVEPPKVEPAKAESSKKEPPAPAATVEPLNNTN